MAQQVFKSPDQQANSLLYEKPKFDSDFYLHSSEDGYKLIGNEARLGKGRLDDLIETYGVWDDNSDYSKAYLGYIDPAKFVEGTTNDVSKIEQESFPLDIDKLNSYPQTMFLKFKRDNKGNVYITGHEGRHRMNALSKAGINRVPIAFIDESKDYDRYHTKPQKFKGVFGGQKFYEDMRGKSIPFEDLELIPLNYKNAATLMNKFGYNK